MPWRHILAGMAYFDASLLKAGLADGCWEAKKKSWCSCKRVRCSAINACHCSLLSFGLESFCALCELSTSMHLDSTLDRGESVKRASRDKEPVAERG